MIVPFELGMSSSQLTNSDFFGGVETTNQVLLTCEYRWLLRDITHWKDYRIVTWVTCGCEQDSSMKFNVLIHANKQILIIWDMSYMFNVDMFWFICLFGMICQEMLKIKSVVTCAEGQLTIVMCRWKIRTPGGTVKLLFV